MNIFSGRMQASAAVAALFLAVTPANATVVFSENFDGENGGASALNYNGFSQFTVTGAVDLINSGVYGPSCAGGTGSCVDLDGTPGAGAIYTTPISFGANERVEISFDLSGSQRSVDTDAFYTSLDFGAGVDIAYFGYNLNGTDVVVPGGGISTSETFWQDIAGFDPMTLRSIYFVTNGGGSVTVGFGTTSSDNVGPVIDNILATVTAVSAVPEPGTWSLMIAGFGLAGLAMRRRRGTMVSFA